MLVSQRKLVNLLLAAVPRYNKANLLAHALATQLPFGTAQVCPATVAYKDHDMQRGQSPPEGRGRFAAGGSLPSLAVSYR